MTEDALRERVARAIGLALQTVVEEDCRARELTDEELAEVAAAALAAARPVIRAQALEEAAKVADENAHAECDVAEQIAAHIRARKGNCDG